MTLLNPKPRRHCGGKKHYIPCVTPGCKNSFPESFRGGQNRIYCDQCRLTKNYSQRLTYRTAKALVHQREQAFKNFWKLIA